MMVSRSHILSVARRDRLIKERVNDPLKSSRKPAKIQVCTVCGLIYKAGRWQHLPATREAFLEFTQCPACLRQRYNLPAGYLTLSGGFLETHETEIRRLVNNVIEQQCHTHPLKRLMGEEILDNGGMVLTFTDRHLPGAVGEALTHAYQGHLDIQYTKEGDIVRVYWCRE